MSKLSVFNFVTLNGFYKGPGNDIGWHKHGGEENDYSEDSLGAGNILVFGRVTYEMMAGYWPSEMALRDNPVVATGMNKSEKLVFSRKLKKADWNNTTLINDNLVEEIKKRKKAKGKDLTILGSGNLTAQLADAGLIDTYQLMIDPVALGAGTPFLQGMKQPLDLELIDSKVFKSGVILLTYQPTK